ncbi:beta-1,3-galactosyl-O-glycosyl-glycoprotein beta-1,6-N-acetylglucosaminyltransferase 4-like [Diadema antillarum]|uniref:beta-1,3-galactosyl-O-glycosyl-glycoprotein beta-1,6-N-acetylglucosaminyltransferase 4-like n=1 Tax=Diadema antillarum TaxID=105358 RepID=UPI003A867293
MGRRRRHHCRRAVARGRQVMSAILIFTLSVLITSGTIIFFEDRQNVPLHLQYPVHCGAILAGDPWEVDVAESFLQEVASMTSDNRIPMPSDGDVSDYTSDCTFFRNERTYPTTPGSREEANFPIAYIFVVHRNAAQLELLLRSLYHPQNVYAIHPDPKSPPEFQAAVRNIAACFDNVFVCSQLEEVQYGRHSRLMADIHCLRDLLEHDIQWRYVLNQCGESFPLKTNLEIVHQLKGYHGLNDVESYPMSEKKLRRFLRYDHDKNIPASKRITQEPPPGNIALFSGNAYNTLSRKFVEYVLREDIPRRFLEWLRDSWSPDEHYWATLNRLPDAPGGTEGSTMELTTYVNWRQHQRQKCHGAYVHHLCVMMTADLPILVNMPHIFANKFYYQEDPIALQCLQERLQTRTSQNRLF